MKVITIILILLAAAAVWYFFIYKRVDAIMVSSSELDSSNIPSTVTFDGKEYNASGTQGTFSLDNKNMPLYYIFGNQSGFMSRSLLGFLKIPQRTTCSGDITISDGRYGFYKEDEKWCLYIKK